MTIFRGLFMVGVLLGVGLTIVHLRDQTSRCAYRIHQLHRQCERMEHDLWSQELALANLCSPPILREKVESMKLDALPPEAAEGRGPLRYETVR